MGMAALEQLKQMLAQRLVFLHTLRNLPSRFRGAQYRSMKLIRCLRKKMLLSSRAIRELGLARGLLAILERLVRMRRSFGNGARIGVDFLLQFLQS